MSRHLITPALLALSLTAAAPALAEPPVATCDAAKGLCSVGVTLTTAEGNPFGTVAMEVAPDGDRPTLVALTPLGIALRPGVRIVADAATEIRLTPDACLPDGCRASAELTADQMTALTGAKTLSLQFFASDRDAPLAADLPNPGFAAALKAAGAALP